MRLLLAAVALLSVSGATALPMKLVDIKPVEHGVAVFICGKLVGLSVFGPAGWEHYRWRSVLESEQAVNRLRDVEFDDVYLTSDACACIKDDL